MFNKYIHKSVQVYSLLKCYFTVYFKRKNIVLMTECLSKWYVKKKKKKFEKPIKLKKKKLEPTNS